MQIVRLSRRVSRVGQGRYLSLSDFDPGWSGGRTPSCRSKSGSKIRPGRCRTRRRTSAADLWRRDMEWKTRKSRKSERVRSEGVGCHHRKCLRAREYFSALTMSRWRAHHAILVWRLVGGCGKVKDGCGEIEGRCSGFRLVEPDPAKASVRLSAATAARESRHAVELWLSGAAPRRSRRELHRGG